MKKLFWTLFTLMVCTSCIQAHEAKFCEVMIWLDATLPISQEYVGDLKNEHLIAKDVKQSITPIIQEGKFSFLQTGNKNVLAYMFENDTKSVLTILNTDTEKEQKSIIKYRTTLEHILPIKITTLPKIKNDKIISALKPSEIMVLLIHHPEQSIQK